MEDEIKRLIKSMNVCSLEVLEILYNAGYRFDLNDGQVTGFLFEKKE